MSQLGCSARVYQGSSSPRSSVSKDHDTATSVAIAITHAGAQVVAFTDAQASCARAAIGHCSEMDELVALGALLRLGQLVLTLQVAVDARVDDLAVAKLELLFTRAAPMEVGVRAAASAACGQRAAPGNS